MAESHYEAQRAQSVLSAMKEVIQYRLSQDSWRKIESYVEGLLEQASRLSETYHYHQGIFQVEAFFDFLLKFHLIDASNLKDIEEKTRKIELLFNKRELLERLRQASLSESKVVLWEAITSSLVEENNKDVNSFEHSNQNIQDIVNFARRVIQETIRIFLKYESVVFLLKIEQVFLVLRRSEFERADIECFIADLSDLNLSEKFRHIKDYIDTLEKLKPNPAWPQVIMNLEKAIVLCSPESTKAMQQKKILKYLNQLIDGFKKYKKYPMAMIDALQGLVENRLLLINYREKNEDIKNNLHQVVWVFQKIEKIFFKMEGKDCAFLESIYDECLVFLKKDNAEEVIDEFLKRLLEKINSKIRIEGLSLVHRCFEEIQNYKVPLGAVIRNVDWDVVLTVLKEKIIQKYHDEKEVVSFDQGIESYFVQLLDSLKSMDNAFRKSEEDGMSTPLKPFKFVIINQLIKIHWFLNTEALVESTPDSIAYEIKLSGIRSYVAKLTLVRKDVPWERVISTLEENIKSLPKKNLDEFTEQAVIYLENLRQSLNNSTGIREVGDFLVFRDFLHRDESHTSKLLKIELDKVYDMLQDKNRVTFLNFSQKEYFLGSIEEISLQLLAKTQEKTVKMKFFIIYLKNLYLAIDDKELNKKSNKSTLYFINTIVTLLTFRTEMISSEEKEKFLLSFQKIKKFLDIASKIPNFYLTFKFLLNLQEELLPLLSSSKRPIEKVQANIRKIFITKFSNFRKETLCKILLPEWTGNQYIRILVKVIARELDKGSFNQDRESAELSSTSEDLKKREEAKSLINQLKQQLETLEKFRSDSKEYAEQNLVIAKTAVSILTLYTKNEEQKSVLKIIIHILEVAFQIFQFYELDIKILGKFKQSLLDFSLKKRLPTLENLQVFVISIEKDLKENLIRKICEKYKLTMSILIQLEEEFLQPESSLTLEEFLHKVQNKVKEILSLKRKYIQEQYSIESNRYKIDCAEKSLLKVCGKPSSLVSRSLNMKDEEYQRVKNKFVSLSENKVNLQHIQKRFDLDKKRAELARIKENSLEVSVSEEDISDSFLEINFRKIEGKDSNIQKIHNTIEFLIKDINSIIKAHPFLEKSAYFFVRFRQSDEDKELAKNLQKFKAELKKLKEDSLDLSEKMRCLANKVQEIDQALSLPTKLTPRRRKTLANFQKILKGEALSAEDTIGCAVSFCTDNQTIKAARRVAIILLEREIVQLQKETKSLEDVSVDELRQQAYGLKDSISKETALIQGSISFPKMREKLRSERSNLEAQRVQLQFKNASHVKSKSLDDLIQDYSNVQSELTQLDRVLQRSAEIGPMLSS